MSGIVEEEFAAARIQAQRLHAFLQSLLPQGVQWVSTCVYYSYPSATVHHVPKQQQTDIVSNTDQLEQYLARLAGDRRAHADPGHVADALSPNAGDVTGTGRWAEAWPDRLS
ncbi:hypothetical protein [Gulosibacter sp. 10]|uniref:hypothetical protein n=1 Tax=Gulosibacter sp. 10 TaxID=1255570 RepID=UPI000B360878|nr:hypothetical protein [Gulosibacter sp. 10]